MNVRELTTLFSDPPKLGRLACARRAEAFGEDIWIRHAPKLGEDTRSAVIRGQEVRPLPAWPGSAELRAGDRIVVDVEASAKGRERFAAWLLELGPTLAELAESDESTGPVSVVPCAATPGGTHRLWCIAAARLALPSAVRVEARHDLLGVRLAQIALGFGADTLGGPIEADRKLPLAGVTRPDETTHAGLTSLVTWAGLTAAPTPSTPRAAEPS